MKNLAISLILLCSSQLNGQILNGGFEEVEFIETWNDSILYPVDWYSDSPEFDGMITTDSYSGNYAMYLTSWYQGNHTVYFYNGSEPIWLWGLSARNEFLKGAGTPIQELPTKLIAHYKFENTKPNDSIIVSTYLKKYLPDSDSIIIVGFGSEKFQPVDEYQKLEVPITKLSNETPDSIIIQIETSTNVNFCENLTECNFLTIDDITVEFSTAVIDTEKNEYTLYPNPTDNIVKISLEDLIESIKIFSASGVELESIKTNTNTYELSFINYPAGIYFIQIMDSNKRLISQRVIKNNR
jgi:hypothetical protein